MLSAVVIKASFIVLFSENSEANTVWPMTKHAFTRKDGAEATGEGSPATPPGVINGVRALSTPRASVLRCEWEQRPSETHTRKT